jgi:ribosomal protein S27AE
VSREATPSSDKEAPSNDAAHHVQDNVRCGNKQCSQCPLGVVTMASHDEASGWEAGSTGMGHISTTTRSSRHSARMPTDYIKRLLEEACPNHAYSIRHKLKGCGMM